MKIFHLENFIFHVKNDHRVWATSTSLIFRQLSSVEKKRKGRGKQEKYFLLHSFNRLCTLGFYLSCHKYEN